MSGRKLPPTAAAKKPKTAKAKVAIDFLELSKDMGSSNTKSDNTTTAAAAAPSKVPQVASAKDDAEGSDSDSGDEDRFSRIGNRNDMLQDQNLGSDDEGDAFMAQPVTKKVGVAALVPTAASKKQVVSDDESPPTPVITPPATPALTKKRFPPEPIPKKKADSKVKRTVAPAPAQDNASNEEEEEEIEGSGDDDDEEEEAPPKPVPAKKKKAVVKPKTTTTTTTTTKKNSDAVAAPAARKPAASTKNQPNKAAEPKEKGKRRPAAEMTAEEKAELTEKRNLAKLKKSARVEAVASLKTGPAMLRMASRPMPECKRSTALQPEPAIGAIYLTYLNKMPHATAAEVKAAELVEPFTDLAKNPSLATTMTKTVTRRLKTFAAKESGAGYRSMAAASLAGDHAIQFVFRSDIATVRSVGTNALFRYLQYLTENVKFEILRAVAENGPACISAEQGEKVAFLSDTGTDVTAADVLRSLQLKYQEKDFFHCSTLEIMEDIVSLFTVGVIPLNMVQWAEEDAEGRTESDKKKKRKKGQAEDEDEEEAAAAEEEQDAEDDKISKAPSSKRTKKAKH